MTGSPSSDADRARADDGGGRPAGGNPQPPGAFPPGSDVAADLARVDWAATTLGPVGRWSQSLTTALRILLGSRFSMWMCWGPELTFFCNDAYRHDTLGMKYPWALGRPSREVWSEIWADIGPRIGTVLREGRSTWDEALLLILERSGYPEETYHTFSYSPLADDDGRVAGMICVVSEDTDRVVAERRMATLRDLATAIGPAVDAAGVAENAAGVLARNERDVPFAVVYLLDGDVAHLAAAEGIAAGHPLAPDELDPADPAWDFVRTSLAEQRTVLVGDADRRWAGLPAGPWDAPPGQLAVLPLPCPSSGGSAGFFVVGLNRYRPVDAGYAGFLELAAGQVAARMESVRAFEEERRRADALAELDRAKTAFFTNVSHEFRTPLTLLLGPAEDALADEEWPLPPVQRTRLELVARNGQRLLRLVNSLLDFSRLAGGTAVARPEPTDLPALTAELARTFAPAIRRAGLTLTLDCPPMPGPAQVDPQMWATILLNLLSNALKFTFEGGVTVSLRALTDATPDSPAASVTGDGALLEPPAIELAVTDTGVGIPPEEHARLFERFHRVLGTRSRTFEGSGIGLALVAELTALHGGTVGVDSTEGAGSTFRVRIPWVPADAAGAARPAPRVAGAEDPATTGEVAEGAAGAAGDAEGTARTLERQTAGFVAEAMRWVGGAPADAVPVPAAAGAAEGARTPTVLVVDDSADMREYLEGLLSQHYRVRTARDGEEALRMARADPPDLVLSDVMMPNLDGIGLLSGLRGDPATMQLPVVLLSARAGEDGMVEGLEAGADDYLIKPFTARELLARVRSNLELERSRRVRIELERRQAMLDQAERMARVGSFEIDLATGRLDASDEMRRMLGLLDDAAWGPPEPSLAEVIDRFVHADDRAAAHTAVRSASRSDPVDVELRIGNDAGSRLVRVWGELVSSDPARPVIRGSVQDIQDQRAAEQALAAAAVARETAIREHRIAEQLQASLLPTQDFAPDGLDVGTYYRAGVAGTQVGGDWYDVIELGSGRTALVVGDVMGRGVRAAAVMGQLRSATRAYARLDLPPADVLGLLDGAVRELGDDHIVTCVYAVFDPFDGTLTYANSGHVPPLVVGPDGARRLTTVSPPLGTSAGFPTEAEVHLPPGTSLTLYTDGLVERRSDPLDAGIDALVAALQDLSAGGAGALPDGGLARAVVERLVPEDPTDDIAVLVAVPIPDNGEAAAAALPLQDDRQTVGKARRWLAATLAEWHIGAPLADDVVLAVDELVTNAVVHADGPRQLRVRRSDEWLYAEVTDGTGVLPRAVRAGSEDEHGRGLQMVGLLAHQWGARPTRDGKSVWCRFALPGGGA